MMYQQAVESPSEWTPQAWGSFVTWLKTNEEPDNYQNIVLTLSSLMQLMADEDVLTAARAQQLVAAMHPQSFPASGNVVSLADRRKQRHPKK
ncbi:hypothetical protein [Lactiplantibacillus fabifermentans]|nr:hypothetical protein [Lactiplantibacillus fabifermentans]